MAVPLRRPRVRGESFVNSWIELRQRNGSTNLFFNYRILGTDPVWRQQPRWSVMRDVLGWGKEGPVESDLAPD